MDKTKLNLERLRAYDAEWEEDKHPRAENGQFTSGSGSGSAGGSSGGGSTSGSSSTSGTKKYNQKDLQKLANNYLNYHLGYNETDATADKVEIVSEPDEHGNVDAKVSYDVSVRIPYQETDSDGYTRTTYEEDSEYRTDIISLNISELKPEEPEAPKSPLRQAAETIQGGGGNAGSGAGKQSKSLRSVLNQGPEVAKGESKWEHEQNIKLMEGLEKAEKHGDGKIVIGWIINDMRNGMSAKEAFAKADKDVQNGMVGGGWREDDLREWWKNWSYKWGPQEEEG